MTPSTQYLIRKPIGMKLFFNKAGWLPGSSLVYGILRTKAALVFLFIVIAINRSHAYTAERILATVNNEPVTMSDYKLFALKNNPALDRETVDEKLLGQLIEEKIILQEARKKGIGVTDEEVEQDIRDFKQRNNLSNQEFEKTILDQGMGLADYKSWLKENIIVLAKFIDNEVDKKIVITDKDVLNYYNQNKNLYIQNPETSLVRAIFIKPGVNLSPAEITDLKIKALKIYSEIKAGGSFDKLVGLYSDAALKEYDGLLGEFRKGDLVPPLDRKLSGMKEGEISDPVWVREGVYILRLEKRTRETYFPVEDVKDDIGAVLFRQKREEGYDELLKSLWGKSSVKINQ